ncbi:hypothetical protein KC19_12G082600 [Ceratodon purpureus]|uniref:Uncharacterized protein n=1 Tax=Ceratodon purpureus TaxID=3225 RepID=A0A8T0G658_CERPU|nr:hypothetical protein KC19_12G082600 [Ceratodon purpureus]
MGYGAACLMRYCSFARLSLRHIGVLKCRSKSWRNVDLSDSEFHRICDGAVHRRRFALVSKCSHRVGAFQIRVFDVSSKKWDIFKTRVNCPPLHWVRLTNSQKSYNEYRL